MKLLVGIVIGILGVLGYQHFQKPQAAEAAEAAEAGEAGEAEEPAADSRFKCDGRQHCSQMNSCEEAEFFLQNCPDVKMDGDNDGEPCERGVGNGPSSGC